MNARRSGMPGEVTQSDLSVTERAAAAKLALALSGQQLAGVEVDGAALIDALTRSPRGRAALRAQLARRGLVPPP